MDYVTRQFINLTKKFRKELRLYVSKLDRALDKQAPAIRENAKAENVNQPPTQQISATVNLPESIEIHHRADEAIQQGSYQNRTLLLSFVTFLALSIYAFIVWLQYREMINATGVAQRTIQESRWNRRQSEKALNATVQQFRLDQRAWLGIQDPRVVKFDRGNALVEFWVSNTGKTPGCEVRMDSSVRIDHRDPSNGPSEEWFTELKPKPTGTVPPQSRYTAKATDLPGQNHMRIFDDCFKRAELGGRTCATLYVIGKVEYKDIFSKNATHSTEFCLRMEHYPNLDLTYCDSHNGMN